MKCFKILIAITDKFYSSKKKKKKKNFVELVRDGEERPEDVDNYIDAWHKSKSKVSLHKFLGLSWNQYKDFVAKKRTLKEIVASV